MTTTPMRAAPDMAKLKTLLSDLISSGDQVDIANILGCTRQDISNRFRTDSERKPGLYEGLREAWALSAVNPEAARKLRAFIDGLFDSWLDPVTATEKNLTTLVGDASQEATDLVRARLESKPSHVQREQALALRATIDQFIAGLDNTFELRSQASNVKELRR